MNGRGRLMEVALRAVESAAPTAAQVDGWAAIAAGGHVLLHAPTGSGKTLAAFLWGLDRLVQAPAPPRTASCRSFMISKPGMVKAPVTTGFSP